MVDMARLPQIILILLVIAVVGIATFLALDGLRVPLETGLGVNETTTALNATDNIELGIANIFDLAPTWGTLIGVSVLLLIVAGLAAVGFMGFGAMRGGGDRRGPL